MATITRTVKYAPCGDCSEIVKRDDMYSMNVKVYDPEDTRETRISIRLCTGCAKENLGELQAMKWDNASMESREEEIEVDDEYATPKVAANG
jgi:hypothetical protein